jgi:periplasmic copper chaperone A
LRAFLLLIALPLALAACHKGAENVEVSRAWVRLSAVPGGPSGGYFTITGGGTDDTLTAVRSVMVERVELHESMTHGGMATMAPLASVPVPADATVAFAPGAKHAMLFGVNAAVTPGTAIPLNLLFASGKTVEVEAKTVPAGGVAPY